MKSAIPKSPLGSEFDDFLFTGLGEDHNGLPLSVLSLFARMNLDPWQEAAKLAGLDADAAATRLTLSLDTLTDPALRAANSKETVPRLLALLPAHGAAPVRTSVSDAGAMAAPDPGTHIRTILLITAAILLVGSQLLSAHRYTPASSPPPDASQMLPAPQGR